MFVNSMMIVVNINNDHPVEYSSVMSDDTHKEVSKACFAVGIDCDEDEIVNIATSIDRMGWHWVDDSHYFEVVSIK